jgi:XTP/dITP diphosphohydrolase
MELVLATRNRDKIKEIEAILSPLDIKVLTLDHFDDVPEVVEDGKTLEENALKKARTVRDRTGLAALADDTGLEVDALGGAPGVYSSRFAGEDATYADNNRKLLGDLRDVEVHKRSARFKCVMALALTKRQGETVLAAQASIGESGAPVDGSSPADSLVTEGIIEGRIAPHRRGESGFGYDPVFEIPRLGKTLAEIGIDAKNRMSHRYRALIEMRELLIQTGLARERRP